MQFAAHTQIMSLLSSLSLDALLSLIGVCVLWGCTNPFLKRATESTHTHSSSAFTATATAAAAAPQSILRSFLSWFTNWRFVIPFVLNQLGSLLYLRVLSFSSIGLSIATPLANAGTLLLTAATAAALGEKQRSNTRVMIGFALVIAGMAMCLRVNEQSESTFTDPAADNVSINSSETVTSTATGASAG